MVSYTVFKTNTTFPFLWQPSIVRGKWAGQYFHQEIAIASEAEAILCYWTEYGALSPDNASRHQHSPFDSGFKATLSDLPTFHSQATVLIKVFGPPHLKPRQPSILRIAHLVPVP